jgi:hypothetical protein
LSFFLNSRYNFKQRYSNEQDTLLIALTLKLVETKLTKKVISHGNDYLEYNLWGSGTGHN